MPATRRLAAILAADVAGYSRLMGADEEGTLDRLKMLRRELSDPKIKVRLAELGGTGLPGSPGDMGKLIADETEKWAKVVKFSGAKPG